MANAVVIGVAIVLLIILKRAILYIIRLLCGYKNGETDE
jgi:hypothetical protein